MGGKPFTHQTLVDRGEQIHGKGVYDYSKVKFEGRLTKVEILCRDHGSFWQTPAMHTHSTKPNGCPACAIDLLSAPKKGVIFTDTELAHLQEVHNNEYTYLPDVVHVNGIRHINVICPNHGTYLANYHSHRNGAACRACYVASQKNTVEDIQNKVLDKFDRIIDVVALHGDIVDFICPEHGTVSANKNSILSYGAGCPMCANTSRNEAHLIDIDSRKAELSALHDGRYTYDIQKSTYSNDTIDISCPDHGRFTQTVKNHKRGQGCPKCANKFITTDEFVERATQLHGTTYSYDMVEYVSSTFPIAIICDAHGDFLQTPNSHLAGSGCPSCRSTWGETLIAGWLTEFGVSFRSNDRRTIQSSEGNRLELDFYIPEYNLAIEFNGLYWHSETYGGKHRKYHLEKLEACHKNDIRLFHVFEDELHNHPELVKNKILSAIGGMASGEGGRKLTVREIDWSTTKQFLSEGHLQGAGSPTPINYGAYDSTDRLIAVMTFGKLRPALGRTPKPNHYELVRFCSDNQTHPGAFSKMLSVFLREYNPKHIVSYADRRWSDGVVYERSGFKKTRTNQPNYWYFLKADSRSTRIHRYSMRKDRLRKRATFSTSGLTEYQIALKLGYDRVWDCGTTVWEMALP